jgi:hypothetical protein
MGQYTNPHAGGFCSSVTDLGGANVTEYGFVYGTSATPTTANNKVQVGTSLTVAGSFSGNLTGLAQSTMYYVRAYAVNSAGTAYGPSDVTFTTTADPYVISNGLLAYYNFDNQNANDPIGSYNGAAVGGLTYSTTTPSGSGYSAQFDGSSGYISVPYQVYSSSGTWSLNIWIKSNRNDATIFNTSNSNTDHIYIDSNSKLIVYSEFNNSLSSSLLNNSWHMLTIIDNGSQVSYYIDAALNESKTGREDFGNYTSFNIGTDYSSYVPYFFKGNMDNIRLYNRVLSSSEITQIYNAKK